MGSLGTRASANASLSLLEEAWVPADIDLGPPGEDALDSVILSGRSEKGEEKKKKKGKKKFEDVWRPTDLDLKGPKFSANDEQG